MKEDLNMIIIKEKIRLRILYMKDSGVDIIPNMSPVSHFKNLKGEKLSAGISKKLQVYG